MARIARLVVPNFPHHITQRGVRSMEVFKQRSDYQNYISYITEECKKAGTEVWAYCLMPNHVHIVMVPSDEDGLRKALGTTHRRYTQMINRREECKGHLWQERFHSFVMDERYLLACVRYVELNPVKAGLVTKVHKWPWSSAQAHLTGNDDGLVTVKPMLELIKDWQDYLDMGNKDKDLKQFHSHKSSGRPLGSEQWVGQLEKEYDRSLKRQKTGPKPKVS